MRNLKRVLSLALACVMVIGMMVMTTGAADLGDYDEITRTEAVDVMVALGVLEGDDLGNFNPDGILTREQAAKIICYMLMGPENAEMLVGNGNFTDVAADRWSAPFIAYCASLNIISGYNGEFNPTGELTGTAFAKMLLVALGYDAEIEGYVNNGNWSTNIGSDAIDAGLNIKGVDLGAAVTRDNAAQMALNALEADMVKYANKGTTVTIEGVDVVVGASEAESKTWGTTGTGTYDYTTGGTAGLATDTIQFCEKYFSDLEKDITTPDAMNRPATTWIYDNEDICTTTRGAAYTTVVANADTADKILLKLNKKFDLTYDRDGDTATYSAGQIVSINGADWAAETTALNVGDEVEVFVSKADPKVVTHVAVTRYSAGKVTAPVATKGQGEDLEIRVPGIVNEYKAYDEITGYEGLKRNDIVYYYADGNGDVHIALAESFQGKLTGTKPASMVAPVKYIIDGTNYSLNGTVAAARDVIGEDSTPVYNTLYNYYTDPNGFVIWSAAIEEEASDYVVIDQIVFVPGDGSISASNRVEAKIVKMDGTTEIVNIASVSLTSTPVKYVGIGAANAGAVSDVNGSNKYLVYDQGADSATNIALHANVGAKAQKAFFTYTTNAKGEYDLTEVVAVAAKKLTVGNLTNDVEVVSGSTAIGTDIYVDENTVFIVSKGTNKGYAVYTGKDNVPSIENVDVVNAFVATNGIADYVFVGNYDSTTVTGNTVFFLSTTKDSFHVVKEANGSTSYYNVYKAIVDGVGTTVKVNADSAGADSITGSVKVELQAPTYNTDGVITALVDSSLDVAAAQSYILSGTTLIVDGSASYTCAADTTVYLVDSKSNVVKTTAAELEKDDNDSVVVITNAAVATKADALVIFTMDDNNTGVTVKYNDTNKNLTDGAVSIAGTSGQTLEVAAKDGKAAVTYSTTSEADAVTNTTTWTNQAPTSTTTYYVKVTAVDGTYDIYTITVTI